MYYPNENKVEVKEVIIGNGKFKKLFFPRILSEDWQKIIFKKNKLLTVELETIDDQEIMAHFDFGLSLCYPITKERNFLVNEADSKEQRVASSIIFDLFHAFFHYKEDPNYTVEHWALYGNLKDRVKCKDE